MFCLKKKRYLMLYFASILCVLHCLITPVLVILLPYFGNILHNIYLELSLFVLGVFSGSLIIYKNYIIHQKKYIVLLYIFGSFFWLLKMVFHILSIEGLDLICLMLSSFLILNSYFFSYRLSIKPHH